MENQNLRITAPSYSYPLPYPPTSTTTTSSSSSSSCSINGYTLPSITSLPLSSSSSSYLYPMAANSPYYTSSTSTSPSAADDLHNARKRKNTELPLFLSKTYTMICKSPPSIASWNHDGTSFYVLDAKSLSEIMIPKYFKHNNFSSFVRQLNFYGFHKVRTNGLSTKDDDTKILQFRHPLFQRDHPELLLDIRRVGPSGGQDYELLKCQVNELSAQVEYLTNTVNELKSIIKRSRTDEYGPLQKLPRLSQRWENPLDDDTLHMLMTLDRDELPEPKVEIRGAPYSHNVFKTGNIFFQRHTSPEGNPSHSPQSQPIRSIRATNPLVQRPSVPLNLACAFFGNLLTEYYTNSIPLKHKNSTENKISDSAELKDASSSSPQDYQNDDHVHEKRKFHEN